MLESKRSGWQFFRIFRKRTSSREPLGCFWMRSCIDVVILIGVMVTERRFERYPMHGTKLAG
ncbi:hypothetical protein Goklo_000082 [Gossypium klotzschianum]|uniref:Uncharacterized protein n=1 Tax=Gossypium klotzschianum TaxID=34286 RepID=A0A7J8WCZ5_9ROSI|nr:hypothetical protein [Gossypium klotzschianum]